MTKAEMIEAVVKGMVGAILVVAVPMGKAILRQSKILFAKAKIESQKKIQVILDSIRSELHVDRVEIFEYSNGENTLGGFPFLYGTMTFESTANHIKSTKAEMIRFPTSWFSMILSPLLPTNVKFCLWEQSGDCVTDDKSRVTDREAGRIMAGYNIEASILIKFTHNIGDGLLSISNHNESLDLSTDQWEKLLADVHKIWYHLKLKR